MHRCGNGPPGRSPRHCRSSSAARAAPASTRSRPRHRRVRWSREACTRRTRRRRSPRSPCRERRGAAIALDPDAAVVGADTHRHVVRNRNAIGSGAGADDQLRTRGRDLQPLRRPSGATRLGRDRRSIGRFGGRPHRPGHPPTITTSPETTRICTPAERAVHRVRRRLRVRPESSQTAAKRAVPPTRSTSESATSSGHAPQA